MKKILLALPVCAALTLGGCSNMNNTQQRTLSAGAIGAAAGAIGTYVYDKHQQPKSNEVN
ncbi:MAG: hypothetical protein CK528_11980 [Alcaligenaceae bacterium]|nr:MAG: hypothetical protein CK528_11980 [Alcaligenaceae bacterium]